MRRLASRAALAVTLAALALLTGCNGLLVNQYYSLPPAREALFYSEFYGYDGDWNTGAESGYPLYNYGSYDFSVDIRDGFVVAREPRQVIQRWDRVRGDIELRIAWQRWVSDPGAILDNGDTFDFRLVLDDEQMQDEWDYVPGGPVVELKLDSSGTTDELRIREAASAESESSVITAPSSGALTRRGELIVVVRSAVQPATINARVVDETGLELLNVSREMTQPVTSDPHVTVQLSGSPDPDGDPLTQPGAVARVVDSIAGLGAE